MNAIVTRSITFHFPGAGFSAAAFGVACATAGAQGYPERQLRFF